MKKFLHILLASALMFVLFINVAEAQITFGTGKINVRVDDYGAIRVFTTEGTDTVQHINRISVLAAGNPYEVMDYWNDLDIETEITAVENPELSDFETSGETNNAFNEYPPNFLLSQSVYGWNNESYFLVKCVIKNQEATEMPLLTGVDVVQYVDFTWEDDKIFYDETNQILTQYDIHYVGIKILSESTSSAQIFKWFDGYEVLDSNYYSLLTEGTFDTEVLTTDADGGVGILGGEQTTLQAGASNEFYFAVSVGSDQAEMLANMNLASQKYSQLTGIESDLNNVPSEFALSQNYPNPFNPTTNISFGLPERSNVVLKVFNMLGEEVAVLVNETLEAGTHLYNFNASKLTSGIYFYSLQTGSSIVTKKMTLLK